MSDEATESGQTSVAPASLQAALSAAIEARDAAYSPYSNFPMGASVIGEDGTVVRGALIENVSLGLAMCSERVALFTAVTNEIVPTVLAVASKRTSGALTFPCGACLQVALEIAGPDLLVVAVDLDGQHEVTTLRELLPRAPHRFTAADEM